KLYRKASLSSPYENDRWNAVYKVFQFVFGLKKIEQIFFRASFSGKFVLETSFSNADPLVKSIWTINTG
ncbi:MAG: hypothetical protein WCB90_11100, partial [Methanosarcina sp.]